MHLDFDLYATSVNHQLPKDKSDGVIYDLYKLGISVIDAVSILEDEFLTKCEIERLNKALNYTLNSLISKHNIDTLQGCLDFTEDFFREQGKTSLKLNTLKDGVMFKIEELYKNHSKLNNASAVNKIESISQLKEYLHEKVN